MFITQKFKGVVQCYVGFLKGFNQSQQLTLVHLVKETAIFEKKIQKTNQKLKWWSLGEEIWVSELPLGLTYCLALWKQKKNFFIKNGQTCSFFSLHPQFLYCGDFWCQENLNPKKFLVKKRNHGKTRSYYYSMCVVHRLGRSCKFKDP